MEKKEEEEEELTFESEPDKLMTELEFLNDNLRRRQNLETENLWEVITEREENKEGYY